MLLRGTFRCLEATDSSMKIYPRHPDCGQKYFEYFFHPGSSFSGQDCYMSEGSVRSPSECCGLRLDQEDSACDSHAIHVYTFTESEQRPPSRQKVIGVSFSTAIQGQ